MVLIARSVAAAAAAAADDDRFAGAIDYRDRYVDAVALTHVFRVVGRCRSTLSNPR